jgi:hypothetical protein
MTNGVPLSKISYAELYAALDAVDGVAELRELAAAYKLALTQQEQRTRISHGDPNL